MPAPAPAGVVQSTAVCGVDTTQPVAVNDTPPLALVATAVTGAPPAGPKLLPRSRMAWLPAVEKLDSAAAAAPPPPPPTRSYPLMSGTP